MFVIINTIEVMKEYQKINTVFYRDENNIIMPYDELCKPEFEWLRGCKFRGEEKVDGTNMSIQVVAERGFLKDGIFTSLYAIAYERIDLLDSYYNEWEENNKEDYNAWIEGGKKDIPSGLMALIAERIGAPVVHFYTEIHGRTANANIPAHLKAWMEENIPTEKVLEVFGLKEYMSEEEANTIDLKIPRIIYGEGYGAKIQKGGNYIADHAEFIPFDVQVGDWMLSRENVEDIAQKLGIDCVPVIGEFTIDEAIDFVRQGFKSRVAKANPDYLAEGLVLKTPDNIRFRNGERICLKIKTQDFVKYRNKYGTDGKVEQKRNPKDGRVRSE